MARATLAAVIVLIVSVQYSYGQNETDLARATNFALPKSCADPPLKQLFTGVHEIQPSPGFGSKFEVLCDQKYDKGGWIVIQNRLDGSVFFDREFTEYQAGFGNLKGEFWLGLDKIHELTYSQKFELVFVLTDWDGNVKAEKYGEFRVAGPKLNYKVSVLTTPGSGDAGDDFAMALDQPFTTVDVDVNMNGCGVSNRGGWWYTATCGDSNLNGLYQPNGAGTDMIVNYWKSFKGTAYGLKETRIMIRPKK